MTEWQEMCRGLVALHRRNTDGNCMACTRALRRPVAYPCPRARMAAPVARATATTTPRFHGDAIRVPGSCTVAAGHPPRPPAW